MEKLLLNKVILTALLILSSILLLSGCIEHSGEWGDAPDFNLISIDNEIFTLSNQHGNIVILDFMYTNCYPCQLQMPELKKIYDQFRVCFHIPCT